MEPIQRSIVNGFMRPSGHTAFIDHSDQHISKCTADVLKSWLNDPTRPNAQALFPSARGGGHLSSDAIQRLLEKHAAVARRTCTSLARKRVSPHVLRHTSASELLLAGMDQSTIALWLGHESPKTTQVYLDASVELKERILAKVKPYPGKPGRYRPDNQLLAFLKGL
jgi:integrase